MNKLVLVLLLTAAFAWWDPSWHYRRAITFSSSASDFVAYVVIDTSSLISQNKTMPDCSDIRIVKNDANVVDYYVANCNSTTTYIFFYVSSTSNEYYLYYGNPSANDASSTALFEFFDNFDSYTINSKGTPTWDIKAGDFYVGFYKGDKVYRVNSTGVGISTSYAGNYSVFTVVGKESNAALGIILNYSQTAYTAIYLNAEDSKVYVCNNTCSAYATYTPKEFNILVYDSGAVYVDGVKKISIENGKNEIGVFSNSSSLTGFFKVFGIFKGKGYICSLGGEEERPPITLQFLGISKANMKTIFYQSRDNEEVVRFELEPEEKCKTVRETPKGGEFNTGFFFVSFNSTGYSVNGTYRDLETNKVAYFDNCKRITLEFYKAYENGSYWHLVQFYKNSPVIKHIIFVSANGSLEINASIKIGACTSYLSKTGYVTCKDFMHSPGGEFTTSNAYFCNIHWYNNGKIYEQLELNEKEYERYIFWENWNKTMKCTPFYKNIELICGIDYSNCSSKTYSPLQIIFYTPSRYPLGMVKYEGDKMDFKINGINAGEELINTEAIREGVNYISFEGNGNISKVNIALSHLYTATLFFNEKPEIYEWKIKGPITGASAKICAVPLFNKIPPFTCYNGKVSAKLNLGEGEFTIKLLKTKTIHNGVGSPPYPLQGSILPLQQYLEMAGAKEIMKPALPPTHKRYTASRLYYSNSTIAEVVITAWRAI